MKQLDVHLDSRLMIELSKMFPVVEDLERHLCVKLTKEELQQINDAAQKEGYHPLSFSFKQ